MARLLMISTLRPRREPAAGPQTCRGGFTPIELLVVVSIVALLIALLLPALGRAREAGRRALCLSNQHQVGVGLYSYAQEFRQHLPWIDGVYASTTPPGSPYHLSTPLGAVGMGLFL